MSKEVYEIRYIDLAKNSYDAFLNGINHVIDKTLPSIWDIDARGWHEQWQNEAEWSGIYASCEGIILLSLFKDMHRNQEVKEIIEKAYSNHLCKAFDVEYSIDEHGEWAVAQKMQREQAINVSFKLSKFLLASSYMDIQNDRLVQAVKDRLVLFFDKDKKQFRNVISKKTTSLVSTVFAFIALKKYLPSDHQFLLLIKERLMKILSLPDYTKDVIAIILSAWAVSESLEMFDDEQIRKAVAALKNIWNCDIKGQPTSDEEFVVIVTDKFTYNVRMIYFHTMITFVKAGFLGFDYFKLILQDIKEIAEIIQKKGMYIREGKKLFWENYQALMLIKNFYELIMAIVKDEEEFMIINPKYFIKHDFSIDDNLAVAIMPFGTEWSEDIFEVFENAIPEFKIWRSDQEHSDDVIMQTIWDNINQAKFVIADCTGRNPNVFYELGIAHTLGKPVFVCAQDRRDIPFDITHIRSYVYGLYPREIKQLKIDIESFASNI